MEHYNGRPTHSHKKIKIERRNLLNNSRRINSLSIVLPTRETLLHPNKPSTHPTIINPYRKRRGKLSYHITIPQIC